MNNKYEKFNKKNEIFAILFFVGFIGCIIYSIFFDSFGSVMLFVILGLLLIVYTIYIIIHGLKLGKNYRKELIATKPKQRFKYLDTFYYKKQSLGDNAPSIIIYNIIEDLDSKKIYAIDQLGTNARFQIMPNDTKLLRIDNIDGVSTRKDWKEVNFDDVGSFWIDQEKVDCYKNDGEIITINYYGKGDQIKVHEMSNINPKYNISILDKATFITGYAQFDNKNNK